MKPGKHRSSKQRGHDGGWKVHDRAHLLFFTHTLYMNYVIAIFLLVSCMNTRNHQLYFGRFCARSTSKIANKNLQQRTLQGFITISFINYAHINTLARLPGTTHGVPSVTYFGNFRFKSTNLHYKGTE